MATAGPISRHGAYGPASLSYHLGTLNSWTHNSDSSPVRPPTTRTEPEWRLDDDTRRIGLPRRGPGPPGARAAHRTLADGPDAPDVGPSGTTRAPDHGHDQQVHHGRKAFGSPPRARLRQLLARQGIVLGWRHDRRRDRRSRPFPIGRRGGGLSTIHSADLLASVLQAS